MQSLAHPAPRPNTREQRALELFRESGNEIREIGTDLFEVPSCAGEGRYQVDYESETCDCPDFEHRGLNCKHILAVGIYHAKHRRRPCVCNDGWTTLGQIVIDPETGEEAEEFALYLCRRCADSR